MNTGNYENAQLVNLQQLDPILDLITICKAKPAAGEYYFEITMAPGHIFDRDKLLAIFREDCVMSFRRGELGVLKGTCRDETVGAYLYHMKMKRR